MSARKRRKTNDILASEVVMAARKLKLDLTKILPQKIADWIEVVAKSRNTTSEFLLLSALPAVATLMGPSSVVKLRSTYEEPLNLFGLVLAPPGAGKSQAFELTVTSPFAKLSDPTPKIIVGDHTRSGLARHLVENHGVALIGSDEIGNFLENLCTTKHDGQEERKFLNKLYDRKYGAGTYTHEYGNKRHEIGESRVCICGFSQDEEFVREFFDLTTKKDGFVDRILFAVPEPHLLKNKAVDDWAEKLRNFPVTDLREVYQEIWKCHSRTEGPVIYTLSEDARKEFTSYSDKLVTKLNSKWNSSGTASEGDVDLSSDEDVSSKDARTVLRLAGVLHVFYTVIEWVLTNANFQQEEAELTKEICETTMKYAIALTDYYKDQRSIFHKAAKGHTCLKTSSLTPLKSKIVLHPGPCITVRSLTRSFPCSTRPNAKTVLKAMKGLEEENIGKVVKGPKNEVFLKVKPSDLQNDSTGMRALGSLTTFEKYNCQFYERDTSLEKPYFGQLLQLHPDQAELYQHFGSG